MMRQRVCVALLVVSWVGGFLHSIIQLSTVYGLPFCGHNVIDHYMCDMYPLLKLVCTDTYVTDLLVAANEGWSALLCFCSYSSLMEPSCTLWRAWVRKGGGKPCRPVVPTSLWCLLLCSLYLHKHKTFPIDKLLSVFYTVITTMLNPLIYSLRNSELTNAMKKLWRRNIISHIK